MLTEICNYQYHNPHVNYVHELLSALVCYDNEYQCANLELRSLQKDLKREVDKVVFPCSEMRNMCDCGSEDCHTKFQRKIEQIHITKECFGQRIDDATVRRHLLLKNAYRRLRELHAGKFKLKQFQQNTIDHLKKRAVETDNPTIRQNCKKDMNVLDRLFLMEMAYINKCENALTPFIQALQDNDAEMPRTCWGFKGCQWVPKGNDVGDVDICEQNIKSSMGTVLTRVVAQIHILQPTDVNSFTAAYLINLERNKESIRQKLELFNLLHK